MISIIAFRFLILMVSLIILSTLVDVNIKLLVLQLPGVMIIWLLSLLSLQVNRLNLVLFRLEAQKINPIQAILVTLVAVLLSHQTPVLHRQ
ncbi:hypothetical protein APM95_21635 [Salmonella enterica subsp. enterica serovar Muenchen]|nr:hypothetical protein [Salmonella enterica subsp. enterica serovar Muenchen]